MIPLRPWADWCPCSTSSWAKWSSAAWAPASSACWSLWCWPSSWPASWWAAPRNTWGKRSSPLTSRSRPWPSWCPSSFCWASPPWPPRPSGGVKALNNAGPHGFSEMLYAFTSCIGNNGSAFAGLTGNTPWYNLTLGLATLIGRFLLIVPVLALAGSLAGKKTIPLSAGSFPVSGVTFVLPAHRHRAHRRGVDLLPGPQSRPHCGALLDD